MKVASVSHIMSKIFISYRRDDSQWQTKRLYDALCDQVPKPKQNIFYDLDSMRVGRDFRAKIDAAVSQCDLMIAVIGKNWLSQVDNETGNRRIDDPNDFVRIEISTALRREIPVVPVLVDETTMPKAEKLPEDLKSLSYRHGVKLRLDSFHSDMDALLNGLNLTELVGRKPFWSGKRLAGGGAAIVSALALALLVWSKIPFLPLSEGATGSFEGAGIDDLSGVALMTAEACLARKPSECTQMGYLFETGGEGLNPNASRAALFYRKACEGGHALGCSKLGYLHRTGSGVEPDDDLAVQFYRTGCDGKDSLGCSNLGFMYIEGSGVEQNYKLAETYVRIGCEGGESIGCLNLGYLYENGYGLKQSYSMASHYYEKACEGGQPIGCTNLGLLYEDGLNGPKDLARANEFYRKGCDGGHPRACRRLP